MLKWLILGFALWQMGAAEDTPEPDSVQDVTNQSSELDKTNINELDTSNNNELEIPNLNDTNLEQPLKPTFRYIPYSYKNKIYAVNIFTKANWFGAQQICSYQGMNLASINSKEDNERLRRYLFDNGLLANDETFWVSGNDLAARGQWTWLSNGLPVIYTNWYPNEPNNAGGNERCIQMGSNGQWNDLHCEASLFFICENRCPPDSYSVPQYPDYPQYPPYQDQDITTNG